jgi:hypothetical protein
VPPDGYRSFGIQRLLQLAFHVPTRWSCGICRTTIIEPQPRSGVCVGGDELKDYAALLLNRIKASESETALYMEVAKIQLKVGQPLNETYRARC